MTTMATSTGDDSQLGIDLQLLLEEFQDVFTEPKELPPYRAYDHKIPLKDESQVVKLRPYRYPAIKKAE